MTRRFTTKDEKGAVQPHSEPDRKGGSAADSRFDPVGGHFRGSRNVQRSSMCVAAGQLGKLNDNIELPHGFKPAAHAPDSASVWRERGGFSLDCGASLVS